MSTHYRHRTIDDRIEAEYLNERGHSRAEIACRVGEHRSTITRELRRCSWQPEHHHASHRPYLRNKLDTHDSHERLYLVGQAQHQASTRAARSHQAYRMRHDPLIDWVIGQLR